MLNINKLVTSYVAEVIVTNIGMDSDVKRLHNQKVIKISSFALGIHKFISGKIRQVNTGGTLRWLKKSSKEVWSRVRNFEMYLLVRGHVFSIKDGPRFLNKMSKVWWLLVWRNKTE